MVTRAYLIDRPRAPSRAKKAFDQHAIPVLINAAASVEQELGRISAATRETPALILLASVGLGWLIAIRLARQKSPVLPV